MVHSPCPSPILVLSNRPITTKNRVCITMRSTRGATVRLQAHRIFLDHIPSRLLQPFIFQNLAYLSRSLHQRAQEGNIRIHILSKLLFTLEAQLRIATTSAHLKILALFPLPQARGPLMARFRNNKNAQIQNMKHV